MVVTSIQTEIELMTILVFNVTLFNTISCASYNTNKQANLNSYINLCVV